MLNSEMVYSKLLVNNNQHKDSKQIVFMNPFSNNELFPEMRN